MNAGVTLNFDATNVEVEQERTFEALPAGWYNVTVTNTERRPSKANPENSYMQVEHTIMDGEYAGRKLFNGINLWNTDPTAVEIAYKGASGLAALQKAVGVVQCESSSQLHGIPLKVKIKIRPARKDPRTGVEYDASNEVTRYAHINENVDGGGSSGAPPWAAANPAPAPAAVGSPPAPAQAPPAQHQPPAPAAQPWAQPGPAGGPPAAAPAPAPAAPAPAAPAPAAEAPAGAPPWLAGATAPAPEAAATPAAPAAPPPQPVPEGPIMLPAANNVPYEEYRKAGWTDEQLIAHGMMAAPAAAAPPPAAAAPAPASAPAAPGAAPPWATP